MGRIAYPDWYVESIDLWIRTFFLIGLWIGGSCVSLPVTVSLTCSIPDRYVVSPAVFLTVTRSHLQYSRRLRGLTYSMPDHCAVSPAVFMTITWSHAAVAAIQERSGALAAAVATIQA